MLVTNQFFKHHHALWVVTAFAALCSPVAFAQGAYPPVQSGQGQPPYPADGQGQDTQQADPPSRVARVSVVQGNVSLQPSGVTDFSPASMNYPLTTGDRIYTDNGGVAELEAGGIAVRLGGGTDLSVTTMGDTLVQFGLGEGSVHLRTFNFDPNTTLELDTPVAAVTVLGGGDVRVDVTPDGSSTQVTLISGQARVDGEGFQQNLRPGESLQLNGAPVVAQDVRPARPDSLDRFSLDRDNIYQNSLAQSADYVSPDTIGAADLGQYGDWAPDGDYGPVWYPRAVDVGWQPYSFGRWAYVAPWGWTWVENEPWGFAPFHYGRWAVIRGRWGWVPGPLGVRPVYSPALVAFVGGGGGGVTAWFPLGPREPFVPWYRTSALYVNRVNVTNIYNRNTVEVRNIYNQRTNNFYANNAPNRVYMNRSVATVAVPQAAFAGGRSIREAAIRGRGDHFAQGPILAHPDATPTRQIMAPGPARALPPRMDRPAVESQAPGDRGAWRGQSGNGAQQGPANRPGFNNQPQGNTPAQNNGFGNGGRPTPQNNGTINNQQPTQAQPTFRRSPNPVDIGNRQFQPGQNNVQPPQNNNLNQQPPNPGNQQLPLRGPDGGSPFRGRPATGDAPVRPMPIPVPQQGNPVSPQPRNFQPPPQRPVNNTPTAPVHQAPQIQQTPRPNPGNFNRTPPPPPPPRPAAPPPPHTDHK